MADFRLPTYFTHWITKSVFLQLENLSETGVIGIMPSGWKCHCCQVCFACLLIRSEILWFRRNVESNYRKRLRARIPVGSKRVPSPRGLARTLLESSVSEDRTAKVHCWDPSGVALLRNMKLCRTIIRENYIIAARYGFSTPKHY